MKDSEVKLCYIFCLLAFVSCSHDVENVPPVREVYESMVFDHNHTALNNVLKEVVDFGLVDYVQLKQRSDALQDYLVTVACVPRAKFAKWPKAERLAFLLNIYNAATLKLFTDHYPVESIKDISRFPSVWKIKIVGLFGEKYSLDDLEHKMIRKQFKSPQIHFALVCGAQSCPQLRDEPYTSARLEVQFAEQAVSFFGDTNKNRVDPDAKVVHLSPIFKWYAEDFGRTEKDLLRFVAPYLPVKFKKDLLNGGFKINYTDYDWSINHSPVQK